MIVKIDYLKGTILYTLLRPTCHSHENAVLGEPHCHLSEPTTTAVLKSHFYLPISMRCGTTYTLPGAFGLMTIHQHGQVFLQTVQGSDCAC